MWPFKKSSAQNSDRKRLAKAKRASRSNGPVFELLPPEGVPITLSLATLGQRLGAQVTDFLITFIAAITIIISFSYAIGGFGDLANVVTALALFFVRMPYYVLTELSWNGRTLAKRWLGYRVISANGRSLTPHQVVARNLMKEVEFFAPLTYIFVGGFIHWSLALMATAWVIILLVVPWRSKGNQRIGDMIANTIVIVDPKPVLLKDIARTDNVHAFEADERFAFTTQNLDRYGAFELQVLEKVLRSSQSVRGRNHGDEKHRQYLADIVQRIVKKTGYPEAVRSSDHYAFLESFYRKQRAHLENRKLFGDQRDDKFFNVKEKLK